MDDIWLLGLSLGFALDAGLLLGLALSGIPVRMPGDLPRLLSIGVAILVLAWSGLPVAVAGARTALSLLIRLLQYRDARRRAQVPQPAPQSAPAAEPVTVIRRIPIHQASGDTTLDIFDTRSARWLAWQTAARRLAGWYAARRSLTADALVPGALADRTAWVALTDELARVGLVLKRNGQRTTWAEPFAVALRRLESGACTWTDEADPPAVALPPAPPNGVVVENGARSAES